MDELEKLLDELWQKSVATEYQFESLEKSEREIKALLEISMEFDAMRGLLESPNINQQTAESLKKDMARLVKQFAHVVGYDKEESANERHNTV